MNTNLLKKFAQAARTKLIEQVSAKLNYVLTHDTSEFRGKADTIARLKDEIMKLGQDAVIEKVAYTWFNRLMALRFMDVNSYQPIGISVISPTELANSVSPQLLSEAHAGNIPAELKVNKQAILDILDGRQASNNPDNDVYRLLLVAACNHLSTIFPFLFERIEDYTELLLPDDLTSPFSIIADIVNGMSTEDCSEVEVIGWLYQFYISEKKDEVFASKSAVKKEDIPAATQLFTPRWIVEYMVQNTLGKLWLQNRPNSGIKQFMPYYIESPSSNSTDYLKINSVEEIRLLDQASGSGHILVYAFDLFAKIYEEEGYNASDIPQLILEKNLNGFEIDERAAQLSGFALMMKARSYNRRFFRKEIKPNMLCYKDLEMTTDEIKSALGELKIELTDSLKFDLIAMQQATNFGSLIRPKTTNSELHSILNKLDNALGKSDIFSKPQIEKLLSAISQLITLSHTYHCIVDNPPYMGSGNMNKELGGFVKANYPDSKTDLMACFMEAGWKSLEKKGFLGMINQHSWMFLGSYVNLRKKLVKSIQFDTLLHLGARAFPEIGGEVVQNAAFTFWNIQPESNGSYVRLVDFNSTDLKSEKTLESIKNLNCGLFYTTNQKYFKKIPGSPIGYWLSKSLIGTYDNKPLSYFATPRAGMISGNNYLFLRYFHEVSYNELGFNFSTKELAAISNKKWFPYQKGGPYKKWYGNLEYVVNFKNNGFDLRTRKNEKGIVPAHAFNDDYIFKFNVNWSALTAGKFSTRITEQGNLFDASGSAAFPTRLNEAYALSGFLNSPIAQILLSVTNPTLNFQAWEIGGLPIKKEIFNNDNILEYTNICRRISISDWDSRETSWDFHQNELIRCMTNCGQNCADLDMLDDEDRDEILGMADIATNSSLLEDCYQAYKSEWRRKFSQLHRKEEELNRMFIEIYGLEEELTPDVPLEDITILKQETSIENGELVFHADEVFQQFISYAVGCMFGRYSLDKEGLILANQGETVEDYIKKTAPQPPKGEKEVFMPDEDNIIPVLDDEWFEDDIVARFHAFLKASFGEKNFAKNLAFVEDCLGKDIRKYFTKDFYKDHVQRYKKRPIYWMFSSPKGYFNVLVYLHRYTPDTINRILNSYLKEFIEKLTQHRKQQEHIVVVGSAIEQNKAQKEIDKIDEMLRDCRQYEIDILYPLATERIALDLDDGVLVNYNKLGNAVALVDGLNDKKTKNKVREFDWIDVTQIR